MNQSRQPDPATREKVLKVLGYLNFSSGSEDVSMLRELNDLFALMYDPQDQAQPHEAVAGLLVRELAIAEQDDKAFADASQARRVLQLTFQHVLPAYLRHHRDLLFHRNSDSLFNSFFIGRVFEIVLKLNDCTEAPDELSQRVVGKLNDYIGHRPVAVLESQKLEPYEHEWVRPVPIYIRQAGVASGPNRSVVECAIRLLQETDPELLELAQFDPALLDELAVDPRSFDFDHPVNKRPNHHFGQWDEHHMDGEGRYRRFVIHQVTLDALTSRVDESPELDQDELILEAGSVLAGTILMAAGICGWGPGAHDSTITLAGLLPTIAYYRDRFYADLLARLEDPHQKRLTEEVKTRQQPFGAARQDLNRQLARYRAFQLVHVNLALVFSRMGYENAAIRHANILPVASSRMICQIECLMYAGTKALENEELALASETLPRLFDLLLRAVNCGAVIDPWNIIGFDANYSLFQGTENTVRDHRADDLTQLMEMIFCFSSQVWIAAQAANQMEISARVKNNFQEIVDWWHKYAVHEVSSVESADAHEIFAATRDVAGLLTLWQKDGAQNGDVQFWANHARSFMSPRAYILAINSLIERDDFVTSMALLIHWLTQSENIALHQSSGSFQALVADWVSRQRVRLNEEPSPQRYQETWSRIRKFCDYVEANAGDFWDVPGFALATGHDGENGGTDDPDETENPGVDDDDNLYRAAYEGMVFRESADDGMDGSIYDSSRHSEESIQAESHRIAVRLDFLQAVAEYWVEAAMFVNEQVDPEDCQEFDEAFVKRQKQKIDDWTRRARQNGQDIEKLIRSVQRYPLPQPDGSVNSLVEYDRQRLIKETILDQAIGLAVDTSTAAHLLSALSSRLQQRYQIAESNPDDPTDPEEKCWVAILTSLLAGDRKQLREDVPKLTALIAEKPLLYVPLSKGGAPLQIAATRVRQCLIGQSLESLPRLGLLAETRELIHVSLMMERNQSVRQGAVTEFDELFRIGYTAMVESLIEAFRNERGESDKKSVVVKRNSGESPDDPAETSLFDCLELLAETMLMLWLSHSQTLRLSVLEKVRDKQSWEDMVSFIEEFGDRIFTQQFLSLTNIRAILHQGVESWLRSVEEQESDEFGWQVVQKIDDGYPRKDAVRNLTWVLEAIIENFNEYRDYNCTTTQSDNGRLLYILLDFLRLRCRYDQVCWNLKPVIWAHESLVRFGETGVARLWRRLLANRVKSEADKLLEKLTGLQEKYSIQMATINQRINERFVHPMQIDRLTSLVMQAMEDPQTEASQRAFDMIENYAESLTQQPIGIGFELPGWISALQVEVDATTAILAGPGDPGNDGLIRSLPSSVQELRDQLKKMPRRN